MEHSFDIERYGLLSFGSVSVYILSYEFSRDRRYAFHNCYDNKMYQTDNGVYPAYLTVKGYFMRSGYINPAVELNSYIQSNRMFELNFDGVIYSSAVIKKFTLHTDMNLSKAECEIVFCCNGNLRGTVVA